VIAYLFALLMAVSNTSQPDPWMLASFEAAEAEFHQSLKDADKLDFSQFTSIQDVYDATDNIQRQQTKKRTLQNLARIKPYLDCLKQYEGVIEVFVQVKPDLLALIWVGIFGLKYPGEEVLSD
jgi:nitrate/nitrite-specific signal transduction histidine kinase